MIIIISNNLKKIKFYTLTNNYVRNNLFVYK